MPQLPELEFLSHDPVGTLLPRSAEDTLILSQLQDAVLFCDGEGRVTYANAAFERLFGWSRNDMLGRHVTHRIPPAYRAEVEDYMAQIVGGLHFSKEWQDFRADGTRVWVHWRAKRICDAAGHVVGVACVATDISERKRAEAEREQLQQQLYQAQKLDTLGNLAGGIAHDFNNILGVIMGFTELAMAQPTQDKMLRHMHEQVLTATKRGRDLVNRILSFSRLHQPLRTAVNLSDVVNEAAKFLAATLPSTVEVLVEAPESCRLVLADANQLHQVLLNLGTNASHAIGERCGTFTLRLEERVITQPAALVCGQIAPGPYVVLSASDTGCGMDAATAQRIFEPFFTTKREGEGTGLGLSVVRAIVESHDGAIEVESLPGSGATFRIYFPAPASIAPPGALVDEVHAATVGARGETVAVIDDEEAMVSVTARVLQTLGYRTLTFRSAAHFHSSFLAQPTDIDVVVTDQTMPAMTGAELIRRLRSCGHDIPAVLMTGFSQPVGDEAIAAFGGVRLLRKPYDRATLGRVVRDLLDERAAAAATESQPKP